MDKMEMAERDRIKNMLSEMEQEASQVEEFDESTRISGALIAKMFELNVGPSGETSSNKGGLGFKKPSFGFSSGNKSSSSLSSDSDGYSGYDVEYSGNQDFQDNGNSRNSFGGRHFNGGIGEENQQDGNYSLKLDSVNGEYQRPEELPGLFRKGPPPKTESVPQAGAYYQNAAVGFDNNVGFGNADGMNFAYQPNASSADYYQAGDNDGYQMTEQNYFAPDTMYTGQQMPYQQPVYQGQPQMPYQGMQQMPNQMQQQMPYQGQSFNGQQMPYQGQPAQGQPMQGMQYQQQMQQPQMPYQGQPTQGQPMQGMQYQQQQMQQPQMPYQGQQMPSYQGMPEVTAQPVQQQPAPQAQPDIQINFQTAVPEQTIDAPVSMELDMANLKQVVAEATPHTAEFNAQPAAEPVTMPATQPASDISAFAPENAAPVSFDLSAGLQNAGFDMSNSEAADAVATLQTPPPTFINVGADSSTAGYKQTDKPFKAVGEIHEDGVSDAPQTTLTEGMGGASSGAGEKGQIIDFSLLSSIRDNADSDDDLDVLSNGLTGFSVRPQAETSEQPKEGGFFFENATMNAKNYKQKVDNITGYDETENAPDGANIAPQVNAMNTWEPQQPQAIITPPVEAPVQQTVAPVVTSAPAEPILERVTAADESAAPKADDKLLSPDITYISEVLNTGKTGYSISEFLADKSPTIRKIVNISGFWYLNKSASAELYSQAYKAEAQGETETRLRLLAATALYSIDIKYTQKALSDIKDEVSDENEVQLLCKKILEKEDNLLKYFKEGEQYQERGVSYSV